MYSVHCVCLQQLFSWTHFAMSLQHRQTHGITFFLFVSEHSQGFYKHFSIIAFFHVPFSRALLVSQSHEGSAGPSTVCIGMTLGRNSGPLRSCRPQYGYSGLSMAMKAPVWPCKPQYGHAGPSMAIKTPVWPCRPQHGLAGPSMVLQAPVWP